MNDLVLRLTEEQEIVAVVRPETTVEGFKAAIDRGYVHCKFTQTRGGTELGIRLDPESDVTSADYANKTGIVKIVGRLILDYVKVRFHGKIDLSDLKGTGHLEILGEVAPGQTTVD
jgi:Core binding factor beta subunit